MHLISHRLNDRGASVLVLLIFFAVLAAYKSDKELIRPMDFKEQPRNKNETANIPMLLGAKIDLNQASVEQIRQIPKLGPKVAKAIFERHKALGHFSNYEQIEAIKGVGPKKLEIIKLHTFIRR